MPGKESEKEKFRRWARRNLDFLADDLDSLGLPPQRPYHMAGAENRDIGENPEGMRDVWCWALSWFLKPPSYQVKRAKQAQLVEAIKQELRSIDTIPGLHDKYCRDSRWCLDLARKLFPRDWPTLGVHSTAAAAYGLRFVEIKTNKPFDAREHIPSWLREWAIW